MRLIHAADGGLARVRYGAKVFWFFFSKKNILPFFLLALLVHLPALTGAYRFDPIYLVSGLTDGTWQTNGALRGYPWLDANAGVTTQALGALAAQDWLHGVLPWWNPYSGIGMPLAAEGQTPAFFLPFVLLLAMPHGLLALRMLLMALAGCFAFALLRRLRVGVAPALAGAALFELNGTFGWFAHGPIMPIAFLPLTLLGLEKARDGKYPWAVAAGVAWSFLAGFPETAVLNMLLASAWGALRLVQAPGRGGYAWRCGTAATAGLLLASPAIWPFLEALPRAFVGAHAGTVHTGFAAASLAQALFPTLLGNPLSVAPASHAVSATWSRAGGYVPLCIVALALAALRRRGPEVALRWTLAGFVGVTAARAAMLPGSAWVFGLVPLLGQAMLHTYIWPAWSLAASVLAALALQDWREGRRPAALPAAVAAVALAFAALWRAAPATAWVLSHPPPFYHPARGLGAAMLLTATLMWLLRGRPARWRQGVVMVLPAAQAGALFTFWLFAGTHGRVVDVDSVRFLQSHAGLGRVVSFGPLVPNYGAMFGVAEVGYNALPVPADWVQAARARLQPRGDGINFYEGALPPEQRLRDMVPRYEALGVHFALTWPGENLAARFRAATLAHAGQAMSVWALPSPAAYADAPGCTVRMLDRDNGAARCAAPARLRRLELFSPGWRATVNGAAAPVGRDDLFQTVQLPAGDSVIRFAYAPPWIGVAWVCCAAGGLLLASQYVVRRYLAPARILAEDARNDDAPPAA